MTSILGFVNRLRQQTWPPTATKDAQPLRFGIISAANIAPMAFLTPAISHPEVVVTAVAARDPAKAAAFAKKHNIPKVKESYQALLDDPEVDCVYVPLPNGLHYEWALRALKAGKHVYLEKPGTSNAVEAEKLFRNPLLQITGEPGAPVLLEATHSWFHPAWARFMSLVTPAEIETATATMLVPSGIIADNDIRYDYALAGGAMMDTGPYTMGALRLAFGGDLPVRCEGATWEPPLLRAKGGWATWMARTRHAFGSPTAG
ncbi:dTDP-3,4-didehydro-2,6-dideoxy-alpha-D-glucose 3-reductase [Microdochium nivale]|nr:dTDP-3,4-didehydro-2,6-dideoxy-alpha-D-glucose 3-reductase [Microdochium nivale]